jgi:transposase
MLDN